ncbi:MAG: hypothetical protein ACWA5K_03535 [bacterium]
MSEPLYEIVMLPNGDVVLQRSDENEEPLVRISFSEEALAILQGHRAEVAKAMIDAGIDAVEQIGGESPDDMSEPEDLQDEFYVEDPSHVVH